MWDGRLGRWMSIDPAGQYPSPYLGMGNNPVKLIDPDGGKTWEPDEYGNLIAEVGDSYKTLAKGLNISEAAAKGIIEEGLLDYDNSGGVSKGDGVLMYNVYTEVIGKIPSSTYTHENYVKIYNGVNIRGRTRDTERDDDFNCFSLVYCGSRGKEIIPKVDDVRTGDIFDALLRSVYKPTTPRNATFGKTVLRFSKGGKALHGAAFYIRNQAGEAYVVTKNGYTQKPVVLKLKILLQYYENGDGKNFGGYGTVQGYESGHSGWYDYMY